MLRSAILTIAAVIQVVASLDVDRYSISRGETYLIPGKRAGEVMPRSGFNKTEVSTVWNVDLDTSNPDKIYYTLQYETSKKFMSCNGTAAVETKLVTIKATRPFHLELVDPAKERHRIHPTTSNEIAVCGAAKDIYAKFCANSKGSPTSDSPDLWDFTRETTPVPAPVPAPAT